MAETLYSMYIVALQIRFFVPEPSVNNFFSLPFLFALWSCFNRVLYLLLSFLVKISHVYGCNVMQLFDLLCRQNCESHCIFLFARGDDDDSTKICILEFWIAQNMEFELIMQCFLSFIFFYLLVVFVTSDWKL